MTWQERLQNALALLVFLSIPLAQADAMVGAAVMVASAIAQAAVVLGCSLGAWLVRRMG